MLLFALISIAVIAVAHIAPAPHAVETGFRPTARH
jgi:hypothetical protein